MTTKLSSSVIQSGGTPPTKSHDLLTMWSREKLKTLYLHFLNTYGPHTWQGSDLRWNDENFSSHDYGTIQKLRSVLSCSKPYFHPLPPPPNNSHPLPFTPIHSHQLPTSPTHSFPVPPTPIHYHPVPPTPTHLQPTPIYFPLYEAKLNHTPNHSHPLPSTPTHSHLLPSTPIRLHLLPSTHTQSHLLPFICSPLPSISTHF